MATQYDQLRILTEKAIVDNTFEDFINSIKCSGAEPDAIYQVLCIAYSTLFDSSDATPELKIDGIYPALAYAIHYLKLQPTEEDFAKSVMSQATTVASVTAVAIDENRISEYVKSLAVTSSSS